MRRVLVIVALVAVAVVAAGLAWWFTRDTSTTRVAGKDAATLVGVDAEPTAVDPGDRPAGGTYEYVGSGRDHFSALGGASHTFPERISVVVELDEADDCAWTMHVVFVAEHREERRFCTEGGGVEDRGFARVTEFLGRENTSTYECSDRAWRMRAGIRPGARWRWTCTEERGGEVAYEGTYVGEETLEIDGAQVDTRRVRIVGRQDDESTGRERTELWLLESGLPARFTSERRLDVRTPLGEMTTTEQWEYDIETIETSSTIR